MHRLLAPVLLVATLLLASCETPESVGPGRRPPPRVLMPATADASERELMPELEDALTDAGFRPTYRTPADYSLEFEVDDGPINADVHLRLLRHGEQVAHAYARTGGPRILLHRKEFIRHSFDKCLNQFESQIHGIARRSGDRYDTYQRDSRNYNDRSGYDQYDDDDDDRYGPMHSDRYDYN